jgi:hypothetical protein
LHNDLDHFADFGRKGARHRIDAAVGRGALEGGGFDAIALVEGDEVGFEREGVELGAVVLGLDNAAVGNH